MRTMLSMTVALFLAGCGAGYQYVVDNYSGVTVELFEYLPPDGPRYVQLGDTTYDRAKTYRIFDKPEQSRLMITASIGDAAQIGFAQGLTKISADHPILVYKDAAAAYLRSKGRECEVIDIGMIIQPQYEARYKCK